MITKIFETIGTAISEFLKVLTSGFTNVMPIFYNETDGFTLIGTLTLIGAGVGLVYWLFYFIRSLTRVNIK